MALVCPAPLVDRNCAEVPGESLTQYVPVSVMAALLDVVFLLEGLVVVLLDLPVKTLF